MDELNELNELKKYKSTQAFAKAHGAEIIEDAPSGSLLASIIKDGIDQAIGAIHDRIESELDPLGIWYVPSEEDKERGKMLKLLEERDNKRPEIKSGLKFGVMPKDKANGLQAKGLFATAWKGFVEEITAGRMEIAEVAVLAYDNVEWSDEKEQYYLKIADLDGRVLRGGVRKIYYDLLARVDKDKMTRWLDPQEYRDAYKGRLEDEYHLYEAVYRANAYADVVDVSDKLHAYVLHFQRKNKDYYGLITQEEYDDLKKLKDYITFMNPENSFRPENNHTPDFEW